MQLIKFGIITKPQGLKGEFRVKPESFNFPFVDGMKEIIINGKKYKLDKIVSRDAFYILKVDGISSCEMVEDLRNIDVYYEYDELKPLAEGEYYIDDIKGCKLMLDDGVFLGDIFDVLTNRGATDVICYKDNNGKEFMFPFVSDIFINVDVKSKLIKVNSKRLKEILV